VVVHSSLLLSCAIRSVLCSGFSTVVVRSSPLLCYVLFSFVFGFFHGSGAF
jgi:hypothetical protein